jgi:hypothetical protein
MLTNIQMFEKGRFQSQTSILIEVSKNDKLTQWLACLLVYFLLYLHHPPPPQRKIKILNVG